MTDVPIVAPRAGPPPTSGVTTFDPSLGELTLYAFNIAGVRPPALTQNHMETARMAANMINSRWSALGINLWTVDLQTIALIPGIATYSVPADTVAILDAYIQQGSGPSLRNRIIMPISRTEYASYSNPTQQGVTSVYWYDQLLAPTITFYLTPNGEYPIVQYYRVRRIQDSRLSGGNTPEIPYYFLEAYALALGHRLAVIWNPQLADGLKSLADEAYEISANRNTENASFYISPMTASYFRV